LGNTELDQIRYDIENSANTVTLTNIEARWNNSSLLYVLSNVWTCVDSQLSAVCVVSWLIALYSRKFCARKMSHPWCVDWNN
jgi:hypothetical protein